jgi:hypothetical protein
MSWRGSIEKQTEQPKRCHQAHACIQRTLSLNSITATKICCLFSTPFKRLLRQKVNSEKCELSKGKTPGNTKDSLEKFTQQPQGSHILE